MAYKLAKTHNVKRLLVLLLAGNVVYFTWWAWLDQSAAPVMPAANSQLPTLTLYSELDTASKTALQQQTVSAANSNEDTQSALSLPAAENAPTVQAVFSQTEESNNGNTGDDDNSATSRNAAPQGYICAALGPFYAPDQAAAGVARLRNLGYEPTVRQTGGQLRSGYWVYLPPFTNREDAKTVAVRLRERGIEDMYIVSDAENRNAISLGLYSTAERADRRAAFLGKLGFSPRIAERFRDATLYWLDYQELEGQPLSVSALGVLAVEPAPQRKTVPCSLQNG